MSAVHGSMIELQCIVHFRDCRIQSDSAQNSVTEMVKLGKRITIFDVPDVIHAVFFSYLYSRDIYSSSQVCKRWNSCILKMRTGKIHIEIAEACLALDKVKSQILSNKAKLREVRRLNGAAGPKLYFRGDGTQISPVQIGLENVLNAATLTVFSRVIKNRGREARRSIHQQEKQAALIRKHVIDLIKC